VLLADTLDRDRNEVSIQDKSKELSVRQILNFRGRSNQLICMLRLLSRCLVYPGCILEHFPFPMVCNIFTQHLTTFSFLSNNELVRLEHHVLAFH
jgi:hypothetical protein